MAQSVAAAPSVHQAIADLSANVDVFLRQVHDGEALDPRGTAQLHVRRLREFVRATGIDLNDAPVWTANIANWRAVARLATLGEIPETTQAG